jgi:hypothetical protein
LQRPLDLGADLVVAADTKAPAAIPTCCSAMSRAAMPA